MLERDQRNGTGPGRVARERGYTAAVPIISMFFGIVVRMSYKEHVPPHSHAEYLGQQGKFDFEGRMKAGRPLDRIEPLE
jgi:hypothetical protein